MVSSKATTVDQYLDELEPERRPSVEAVRDTINAHLPDGIVESMEYGMIAWHVDVEVSGPTDTGKPIHVAALAAQKNKLSLYLSALYLDPEVSARFEHDWKLAVGSIDRGKSCVRFKDAEHAALDVVAQVFDDLDVQHLIGLSERPSGA